MLVDSLDHVLMDMEKSSRDLKFEEAQVICKTLIHFFLLCSFVSLPCYSNSRGNEKGAAVEEPLRNESD